MSENEQKKSSGQLRKEKHEAKLRQIQRIKDAGLYASRQDRAFTYGKKVSEANKRNIDFVANSFKFIRQESAFVPIVVKLSEKYDMTYYDTAVFMYCSFTAMQDTFDSLSTVNLKGHFKPHKVPLRFLKNPKTKQELMNRWESLTEAIRTEHTGNYFYEMKFLNIIGYKVLKYFHEINRLKKMGISKKFSANTKIIINLLKNRHS